ncbi:MAG: class II aldolase/adducin family protein [Lawsonibacter sp.]|nr:class II aldolase/adducin family protein [Lawsonibacter sp.]
MNDYITSQEAKSLILEMGRRLYQKGFVAANDGNISCMVGPNTLWTTPTGVSKGFMTEDMLVKVDLEGNLLLQSGQPSSELKMHLRVYRENPRVRCVVHAHPPVATAFAVAGLPLNQPILAEGVAQFGEIPVAPYATPGTQEVPDAVAPFCNSHNGILLANHGALTWDEEPMQAYLRMESLEHWATVTLYTRLLGQANPIPAEKLSALRAVRAARGN